MTHPPSRVLVALFVENAIGVQPSTVSAEPWKITYGSMPAVGGNTPVTMITVYDTDPAQDGRLMRTGERIQHPGFQVKIRSVDYLTGWNKGMAIQTVLDAVKKTSVTVGTGPTAVTYLLQAVKSTNSLTKIGEEENQRQIFVINGTMTLKEV